MDIKEYIIAAAELDIGSELFIPCNSRKDRKKKLTKVLNAVDEYMNLVNMDVNLEAKAEFKDGRYWIKIRKIPLDRAFFIKTEDGIEKRISDDPLLRRMIKLMRQDNFTEEEIRKYVKEYQEGK